MEGFGEETLDILSQRVYPDYFDASIVEGENLPVEGEATTDDVTAVLQKLNAALVKESTRQWGAKETEISDDREAIHLQKPSIYRRQWRSGLRRSNAIASFLNASKDGQSAMSFDVRLALASGFPPRFSHSQKNP